jgi:hypothetical protein
VATSLGEAMQPGSGSCAKVRLQMLSVLQRLPSLTQSSVSVVK